MGKTVDLRTEVPGPKSRAILDRKRASVANFKDIYMPVVIDHGHGCVITDVDGNTFLDWSGGIGCLNVGHTNAAVSRALHEQIDKFLHTDFTIVPYEAYVEMAEQLLARAPITGPKKAAFFNSGAEAVENAVKVAKLATGRQAVIAFEGAFHGRTLMAMSLTSKPHPYKAGMGPFAAEVYRAPFPNPYRWPGSDPAGEALAELRRMFTTHVAAENVAAIIVEPVQGEGGFVVPPPAFLPGLREIADEFGIVLIADEVQSGFGPHREVLRDRALRGRARSDHGGKVDCGRRALLGCAGPGRADGRPARFGDRRHLCGIAAGLRRRAGGAGGVRAPRPAQPRRCHRRPHPAAPRGARPAASAGGRRARLGADAGARVRDRPCDTKQPAPAIATAVFEQAAHRGLIVLKAGLDGNCVRVLVPLVATDEQLDEALDILSEAVAVACGAPALAAAGD